MGVEVMKTQHKGFGVRACRSFEPHQIIVEYTGEVITQDECDKRMLNEYKDDEVSRSIDNPYTHELILSSAITL